MPIYLYILISLNKAITDSIMNASETLRMMSRQPSIVHFPKISPTPEPTDLIEDSFLPVLKNKRYNMLKIK